MSRTRARSQPLVSVVVPTFNDGRYLAEALTSIDRQQRDDIEVIVVDDGSTVPAQEQALAILPDARVIRQANAGPSAARNRGIEAARGQFIGFLDADDLWVEDAVARFLAAFRNAPSADLVHGYMRRFRTGAGGNKEFLTPPYCGFQLGTVMARRAAIQKTGTFDETLRQSEDVDLFLRMQDAGLRRVVVPDVLVNYRWQERHAEPGHALDPRANGYWMGLLRNSLARKRSGQAARNRSGVTNATVSVILTVRNGLPFLPAALESVRRQTLAPSEIIACVGNSSDGTLEFLREQPDVKVVEQDGEGLAEGRNQGLSQAVHPWIAFLDHDDLWHADKLAKQIEAVSMFDRPAACIVNFHDVADRNGSDVEGGAAPRQKKLPRVGWTPSALLAHRDIFHAVGPFDPTLGIGCDTEWFDRLRRSEVPCTVAGRVLLWKRRHADSLSADPLRNREAMFKIIRKRRRTRNENGGEP